MGFLYICFSFIDGMLSTGDLQRWYYLKLFIHPLLVLFCELYEAARIVPRCVFSIFFYPFRLVCYAGIGLYLTLRSGVHQLVVIMELDDASIIKLYGLDAEDEGEVQEKWFDAFEEEDPYATVVVFSAPRVFSPRHCSPMVFELPVVREFRWRENHKESPPVVPGHGSHVHGEAVEEEETPLAVPVYWNDEEEEEEEEKEEDRLVRRKSRKDEEEEETREEEELELVDEMQERQENLDVSLADSALTGRQSQQGDEYFYREYAKGMGEFDTVMKHRMFDISNLLGVEIKDLLGDMKAHMKILDRRLPKEIGLARSLQIDLEMVYVGQSCLSWEALQKHHRRFEELAAAGQRGAFCFDAADKFKQFHVRLERFLENERYDGRYDGKRFWNYIKGRWDCGNLLLQVPQVSGYTQEEQQDCNGESMTAWQVLMIIGDCIEIFSRFLDADNIKSAKKLKKFLGIVDSPVEHVNDLGLLDTLVREARKKEVALKELEKGRKHWWNRRTAYRDDPQKYEILFSMVDAKLVSRALKMSSIPTQHLRWCEEKLNNINLNEGKLTRSCTASFFPLV